MDVIKISKLIKFKNQNGYFMATTGFLFYRTLDLSGVSKHIRLVSIHNFVKLLPILSWISWYNVLIVIMIKYIVRFIELELLINTKKELLHQINKLQNLLIETGLKEGINSKKTLAISQDLDRLIFEYQRRNIGI
jgi:hypothetical protein